MKHCVTLEPTWFEGCVNFEYNTFFRVIEKMCLTNIIQ